MVPTPAEMDHWNRMVERQANSNAGFCGYCGEACQPFVKGLPQELKDTACEYDGDHPMCDGNHSMVYEGQTPETFGGYEIWICENPKCTYQEAY